MTAPREPWFPSLRELAEKADAVWLQRGPWHAKGYVVYTRAGAQVARGTGETTTAEFIAAADPETVLRLIGALDAIRRNAEAWHGGDAAKGRALAVIASWAADPGSIPDAVRGAGNSQPEPRP